MRIQNLYQLLVRSVDLYPNRPLFHNTPTSHMTYNDFMRDVKKFRYVLQLNDVNKGDNVVIIGNNSQKWASLAYAVWGEGGVVIPMYEKQSNVIKKYVIDQTKPKMLFNSANCMNYHKELDHNKEFDWPEEYYKLNNMDNNVNYNDLSTILYTSGTTGNPKGVPLTHGNILSNIEAISERATGDMEITCEDKYVSFLPWAHCYGLNCELNYLISKGASTYLNKDLTKLRNDFVEHNPTVLCGVPKLFSDINKRTRFTRFLPSFGKKYIMKKIFGNNLRFGMVGGASINPDLLNYYFNCGVRLYQGYGITECSPLISSNTFIDNKVGSVGKILNCNNVKIVNDEICVSGTNIFSNYYLNNDEDSFLATDGKKYFRTGDSGHIDNEGYLYVTGRIKETYKLSNGKFINPDEIERTILQIPEVTQIMVYAKQEDQHNRAIVVTNLDELSLRKKISLLRIDKFKIPFHLTIVNEQFTLDNGLITPKQSLRRNKIIEHFKL